MRASEHQHPQHATLAIQAKRNIPSLVHHIVITVEKTYASIVVPPLEIKLKALHNTSPSDCRNYRFWEWTRHDQSGLEFTLLVVLPPLPPSRMFGKTDPENGKPEMVRCVTAHHLWKRYHIASPPVDVYKPTHGWWLLVTFLDASWMTCQQYHRPRC